MLEPFRHGGGSGRPFAALHGHAGAIQPRAGFNPLDWTDVLMPRSLSAPASAFNVWELSPNKLRTAAVAFTFCITAGYISLLAAGGLLAILVTGAVVTCCVLVTVLTCATLITLIVTGVPVGYALMRLLSRRQAATAAASSGGSGGGGSGGGDTAGLFSGIFGHSEQQQEPRQNGFGRGSHHGGVGVRPPAAGGWHFREAGAEAGEGDADDEE
ncbi:hypothetical protein TSOC_010553 [Tetrabaena socialis]|uniref:Uncharacterized protein n=1 Tax=Tetrabaena socialis TaxID=47790 RepID=A0A2J7ZSZ1_9CHLO|nr:hypothetical protein TSOC_010553 [Tetrabaena socialis]|eukprot:PNH03387.1 hypothetical protein TSOC_010553 [Tetrabaena socialis]